MRTTTFRGLFLLGIALVCGSPGTGNSQVTAASKIQHIRGPLTAALAGVEAEAGARGLVQVLHGNDVLRQHPVELFVSGLRRGEIRLDDETRAELAMIHPSLPEAIDALRLMRDSDMAEFRNGSLLARANSKTRLCGLDPGEVTRLDVLLAETLVGVPGVPAFDAKPMLSKYVPALDLQGFLALGATEQQRVLGAVDGVIPLDADGLPDATALVLAHHAHEIVRRSGVRLDFAPPPAIDAYTSAEQGVIRELAALYEPTMAQTFQGRNGLLQTIEYAEITPDGFNGPTRLWSFIELDRFRQGQPGWWTSNSEFGVNGRGQRPAIGAEPPDPAHITSATSRSPLRQMYGEGASREIYWATKTRGSGLDRQVDFSRLRIAVNYDPVGRQQSLETWVRDGAGIWQPFFLQRIGDLWVPATRFQGIDIPESCLRCHTTVPRGNIATPRPHFLDSEEAFLQVGYQSPHLIRQMLEF